MTGSITLFVYTGQQNQNAFTINTVTMISLPRPENDRVEDHRAHVREVVELLFGNPEVASVTVSPDGSPLDREMIDNPRNVGKKIVQHDHMDGHVWDTV